MRRNPSRRRYLTVPEFCALTRDKPDTVRGRCERGELRCRKTGSRWRIWAGEAIAAPPAARKE